MFLIRRGRLSKGKTGSMKTFTRNKKLTRYEFSSTPPHKNLIL